jgi:hypothetical protein
LRRRLILSDGFKQHVGATGHVEQAETAKIEAAEHSPRFG